MMKKMALKSLIGSLMGDDEDESMEHEMGEKGKMKATIMADSKEGLIEGAKKLPEILSKSEKYMQERMSEIDEKPKKKKK